MPICADCDEMIEPLDFCRVRLVTDQQVEFVCQCCDHGRVETVFVMPAARA